MRPHQLPLWKKHEVITNMGNKKKKFATESTNRKFLRIKKCFTLKINWSGRYMYVDWSSSKVSDLLFTYIIIHRRKVQTDEDIKLVCSKTNRYVAERRRVQRQRYREWETGG